MIEINNHTSKMYEIGRTRRVSIEGEVKMENMTMTTTKAVDRVYEFVKSPAKLPNGRQPAAVLHIIKTAGKAMSVAEVAAEADKNGYAAAAGTTLSVSYHLHQLSKAGVVKVVGQATPAQPATPVIDFGTDEVKELQPRTKK